MPNIFPEFGQCVHKMTMHPSTPNVIYQQNHCGVYRSDNAGEDWIDLGEGKLPTRFGFPIAVHPTDPRTIYIVLEESQEYHMSVDGRLVVWRSRDAGESWQELTNGLPEHARVNVLREAMGTDTFEERRDLLRHEHRSVVPYARFGGQLGTAGGFPAADPIGGGGGHRMTIHAGTGSCQSL
jgi:hypothetical protein